MQPPQTQRRLSLNPFVFPTETDIRFRLLVLIVAGSSMGLGALVMQAAQVYLFPAPAARSPAHTIVSLVVSIGTPCLVFALARRRARRSARALIRQEGWRPFPPQSRNPAEQASLDQMWTYVQAIVAQIPNPPARAPAFVWDNTSPASHLPAGMAFGYGDQQYVCLQQGLHPAFIADRRSGIFRAVLLHELAHIANRDVSKTTFSIALSQTFVRVAVALVGALDVYLVFNIIRRILTNRLGDGLVLRALLLMLSINALLIVLLLLVEVIRSSILRVREHYADVRAVSWLGSAEPLATALCGDAPARPDEPPRRNGRVVVVSAAVQASSTTGSGAADRWARVRRLLRARFAPLHPTTQRRIAVLHDVRRLFQFGGEIALLAGLLIGLALNAGANIVSGLGELLILANRLNDQVQLSDNPLFIALGAAIITALQIGWVSGVLGVWLIFGLAPAVGTLGTQLQKAAFADLARPADPPLIPARRLVKLAILFGLGVVLGGVAAPVPNSFSLWGRGLLLVPLFAGGWALVAALWMFPLRWVAGRLFVAHRGETPPRTKRRVLTISSALAFTPLFLAMLVSQIALGAEAAFPGTLPVSASQFLVGGVVLWFAALVLSGFAWASGVALMAGAGWFRFGRCGACGTKVTRDAGMANHCCQCGARLAAWATLPEPIVLPPPAPLAHTLSSEPPPL